eukprot:scaffold18698_cov31-Tisochrysis_lutea.AAC.2
MPANLRRLPIGEVGRVHIAGRLGPVLVTGDGRCLAIKARWPSELDDQPLRLLGRGARVERRADHVLKISLHFAHHP